MIGNDIVDLKVAAIESNWRRPRFLDKVFSLEEQRLILNASCETQMVWLLWSMKESAYKIYTQQYGGRFFNPEKLQCELVSENKGMVYYLGNKYLTNSEVNLNFISTWASSEESKNAIVHSFSLEGGSSNAQSHIIKQKVQESFSSLKNISTNELEIRKNSNYVPRLFYNGNEQRDSFSIAHHGCYGAYVIES